MDTCSKQSVEVSPQFRIVMFASAVSALIHDDANFPGIVQGSLSFLMLYLGMVSRETVGQFFEEPVILVCVGIFRCHMVQRWFGWMSTDFFFQQLPVGERESSLDLGLQFPLVILARGLWQWSFFTQVFYRFRSRLLISIWTVIEPKPSGAQILVPTLMWTSTLGLLPSSTWT